MASEARESTLEQYVKETKLQEQVQAMLEALLEAKPKDPEAWLLSWLELSIADESDALPESDSQKLFAASRRITSEIMPAETIRITVSETLQLLGCDFVSLYIFDKKTGMLRLTPYSESVFVSPGEGVIGSVFQSRETVTIGDTGRDWRYNKAIDGKAGHVTQSLVAAPIIDFDGSCMGVIQAVNKHPPGTDPEVRAGALAVPFPRSDARMLQHLAEHIAVALRNAEVYREAISASDVANGLLSTISSLSQDLGPQPTVFAITMHAGKVVSAQRTAVYLVDAAEKELWSIADESGEEIRTPYDKGIVGQCCTSQTIINIKDTYSDPSHRQEHDIKGGIEVKSVLAVPVFQSGRVSGTVVGVIKMVNKISPEGDVEHFTEADQEVMQLFASFVGQSLQTDALNEMGRKTMETATAKRRSLGEDMPADVVQAERQRKPTLTALTEVMDLPEDDDEEDS